MAEQCDVRIELTTSHEDWALVRECYVQSFHRYPLYKYMIPDDNKRDAFLRAYLDANYDVTVATGQGILLRIGIPSIACSDRNNNRNSAGPDSSRTPLKIIGGVVFVPPSRDGHGWAITDDEPYWEAYEKHGLAKISAEGFERVKRYEAWENENICRKLSGSRIPMWNGLFCAISPEYSSKGLGSAVYKEAIRIMAQYWVKQQKESRAQLFRTRPQSERLVRNDSQLLEPAKENKGLFGRLWQNFSLKEIHRYALLSHRALPQAAFMQKPRSIQQQHSSAVATKPTENQTKPNDAIRARDIVGNPSAPLVVAVSHSDRAARFHEANGFHPIARTPYHDEVEGTSPFYTHVLVLDPFRTGRVNELGNSINETITPYPNMHATPSILT
nr:uncharacterized protein LOC100180340 [Ciona intestinalis]|eukprot:XP_002127261.1 uncharacterized protein LOC100180340 [Ciona intestinalis]